MVPVGGPVQRQRPVAADLLRKLCGPAPEWDITFVYGVSDEASAAGAVAQDPEASADVFMYANDTLTIMTDANALAKFGGIYAEELQATNSETLLDSLTLDGNIYGVPFTTNTWYMYYDKSVFTEEDVKSLDTMLEKGVVSFPFVNSWYLPAFYFGNGCTLFGDGTQEELGADFGGENAVEVTEYLVDLAANPNFKIDQDGSVWRDCGTAASTHLLRLLGCGGGTGDPGRRYGRGGPAYLHPERGGKADVRLRRVQGHRREHRHQVYESLGGAGHVPGFCRSPAAAL